jgi:cytosine/adenosine deaminase-related metal-dependent hydrolase
MPFSLQARVVFPVDRPPIEHGVVTIDGEQIVTVGTTPVSGELIDLGPVALLPGLVNAHTHLEFSYLQQPLGHPGMSLVDWIRLVIAERGRGDGAINKDPNRGLFESLSFGVTTIGDITTTNLTSSGDVTHFQEVIAFSRARSASALNALEERIRFQQGESRLIKHGISPHAPYTVSPKLVQALVSLAGRFSLPMAMHLAESREELELLRDRTGPFQALLEERSMWDAEAIPRGTRPIDYLRMLADASRSLVVHGNYLNVSELSFLGANRSQMSLVYCPRTHAYFDHQPYPLAAALGVRVRVALGTDSRASSPDLNLLAEMRHVLRIHPWLNPQDVLRMGTLSGAKALGRDRDVGSISEKKLANLVAIPICDDRLTKPNDILSAIFAAESAPSAVYLAGHPLNS